MKCEGTHFGVKFSYAPLWQALRAIHACSRSSRGGENTGSNSHFEAILGFFGKGACFHAEWPLFKTPFALWCLPLAPYTQAIKKQQK